VGYIDDKSANNESYDPSVSGLAATDVQAAIDALSSRTGGGGGVTPFYQYSRAGTLLTAGTYLNVGTISSGVVGQLVTGTNKIVRIAITTSAAVGTAPAVFQIQRRTGVTTFSDIAGANISIPVSSYKANLLLSTPVSLNADEEISAYIKSGSPSNPLLLIFVTPS
jgi:hypothetical protein